MFVYQNSVTMINRANDSTLTEVDDHIVSSYYQELLCHKCFRKEVNRDFELVLTYSVTISAESIVIVYSKLGV